MESSVNQNKNHSSTHFLPYSKIPSWIFFLKVSGNALGVYQYLYILDMQFNQVHPSLEKICLARNMVRNTARRALKELQDISLLQINSMKGKGRFASTYEIIIPSIDSLKNLIDENFHYTLQEFNRSESEPIRISPVQTSTGQKLTRKPVRNEPVNRSEIDPHNNVLRSFNNDDDDRAGAREETSPPSNTVGYITAEQPKSEIRSLREENQHTSLISILPEIIECRSNEREFRVKKVGVAVRIQELMTPTLPDGTSAKLKFFPNEFITGSNLERVLEAIQFKESKFEKLDSSISHSIEKFEATIDSIIKRKKEDEFKILQKQQHVQNVRYFSFKTEEEAIAFEREEKAKSFFKKFGGNN